MKNYEDNVRTMIDRENDLINARLSWMANFYGFLAAAIAFLWDKPNSKVVVCIFCGLGIVIAIASASALVRATRAIFRLHDWWEKNKPSDYSGPGMSGLHLVSKGFWRYVMPWNILAAIFFAGWVAVLIFRLRFS